MKLLAAALLLFSPDASWNGRGVDLTRLELLRTFGPWKISTLSPAGQSLGVYSGNSIVMVDVRAGRKSLELILGIYESDRMMREVLIPRRDESAGVR